MSKIQAIRSCMCLVACLSLFVAVPASAWVGVGAAPTCEVRTIQAAVDRIMARERSGDFVDPLIVVTGGTFNEAVNVDGGGISGPNGGAIVTIVGGYAADCSGPQSGLVTTIDATNRSASVLTIHGKIAVSLDTLSITGANTAGNGGGIDFDGAGTLDVTNVDLRNNHAGRGGGLYANGSGSGLKIHLHHDVDIFGNSADHSAGGIRVQGSARLFMLEGSHVSNNSVSLNDSDGAGGGLQVVGPARADIGSSEISFNSAKYGGGISVNGVDGDAAIVRFFMNRAGEPTRIESNRATHTGGGLYVNSEPGIACGYGYSIGGNVAENGAAIYLDTSSDLFGSTFGGYARLSASILADTVNCGPEAATALGALACPVGGVCNTMDGNRAEDGGGAPVSGSTVVVQSAGAFTAENVELRGNHGQHVVLGFETDGFQTTFANSLMADNVTSGDLIRMEENGGLQLKSCTIANNVIGGSNVFSLTGDLTLTESLVWQSNRTTLAQEGGHQRNVRNVLASEIVSLGGGPDIESIYPQFVDPTHGDYHITPASHALDYAVAASGTDLEGHPRSVDLPTPNRPGGGPLDLGAYERQTFPHFPPDENFDELTVPALPEGWLNDEFGGGAGWFVVGTGAASQPNAVFTDDPPEITDKSLETPPVTIVAGGRLRFRHKMDLEDVPGTSLARDGVVLEIAIAAEPFKDIFQAGGSFASGAYDHVIPSFAPGSNPLKGRAVWSGTTQGLYQNVVVKLPASADGKSVRLHWRMGTDDSGSRLGYWLDDIRIDVNGADRIFCNSFEVDPNDCP
ncbi:MAG: hypothetical protein ABIQ70_11995 [Dokdonella sp.]